MFRHIPPYNTYLRHIRLYIKAFFIYTRCLSDTVKKNFKIRLSLGEFEPTIPQKTYSTQKKTFEAVRGFDLGTSRMQNYHFTTTPHRILYTHAPTLELKRKYLL